MDINDVLLMAYVDGELDPETSRAVEAAIRKDPEAQAKVAVYRQSSAMLRSAFAAKVYAAEAELIRAARTRGSKRVAARRLILAAACVALTLAGFGIGRFTPLPESQLEHFADEVVEYHEVYAQETVHLAEVPAAQLDTFETWMRARIGPAVTVPDLTSQGLQYAGGRMLVVSGKPVADMLYTRQSGKPVALCVTVMDGERQALTGEQKGDLHVATWSDGVLGYVLVGKLDSAEALTIARAVATKLSQNKAETDLPES